MNRPRIFPKSLKESGRISKHVNSANFLAHMSRRLKGELIVYPCSGVRCRRRSPFSNMNVAETSRPIAIKFYLKHH